MSGKIGGYAFLIGILLAILAGIFIMGNSTIALILVILGIIVGFLNISDKETTSFLIASIALIAVGTANLGILPVIGSYVQGMVQYMVVFVAPSALVVALKEIKTLAEG